VAHSIPAGKSVSITIYIKNFLMTESDSRWVPIMRAYDQNKPAYFGTPAVTLVRALHTSLIEITRGPISLATRLALHIHASDRVKKAAERLGMEQVAYEPAGRAHGMTALYVSEGLSAADVLGGVAQRGVVIAGGLVKEVKDQYIRVGHMGWSVVGDEGKDVSFVVRVIEEAVKEAVAKKRVMARL
jgi:alanine-glyoxylate transaminase/serine-glyoxylate transaminase/serine-pyruvate transaminase